MIQESYVAFEQAKELKGLGFPQDKNSDCLFYDEEGGLRSFHISPTFKLQFKRPTLSLAKKWINEVFGVFIYVVPRAFDIETKKQRDYQYSIYYWDNMEDCEVNFDTEDDALSAAIDKAIKQIKFDKERGVFDK